MFKTYKIRIYPNNSQKNLIQKNFRLCKVCV